MVSQCRAVSETAITMVKFSERPNPEKVDRNGSVMI